MRLAHMLPGHFLLTGGCVGWFPQAFAFVNNFADAIDKHFFLVAFHTVPASQGGYDITFGELRGALIAILQFLACPLILYFFLKNTKFYRLKWL